MKCLGLQLTVLLICSAAAWSQQAPPSPVRIAVDYTAKQAVFEPVWAYFGYDECNYTYMKYGKKLLGELSRLGPAPVYLRCHNLLTSGDGTPSLKWGSTNAYREDESGRPIYEWTILDRIFDAYRETGTRPLVEIGFMPEALSIKPQPYRHDWPKTFSTGWAYPPSDHKKWADFIHAWVKHCVDRYGKAEVESWLWELWNEPDIGYWKGTPEEYHKLYDFTADAVKRALPTAKIGGPHTTNPGDGRSGAFLRGFLEHCARGTNHATGKTGAPLDYIAFHAKGATRLVDGRPQMNLAPQLKAISKGFEMVASFPEWKKTPIIIGESDPEGSAASAARLHPQNSYRNGSQYAAYTAATIRHTLDLAREKQVNFQGAVTWAFEFEDQPCFEGFRTLATNGIDKPVLNLFRMLGLMSGDRLATRSNPSRNTDSLIAQAVRTEPYIDALATGADAQISVLIFNYHDDTLSGQEAAVELAFANLPPSASRVLVHHYRVDHQHSNAHTVWQQMGSPQKPSEEQYARLQAAGQLQMLSSPQWSAVDGGRLTFSFILPPQGVSLVQLTWHTASAR